MTVPANAHGLGGRLPSDLEKAAANQMRRMLASQMDQEVKFKLTSSKTKQSAEVVLTPALSELLMELLRHVACGDTVTLVPVGEMLTTQQAADILNVSRPFFIKLLEEGHLSYELVGRHRRIRAEELFAFKENRDKKRSEALSSLARSDAELL
jgi:excisionase family DNA binding protein